MLRIAPIADVAADTVERLLDAAFGTDRHGRTAYRIREGMAALPELSFAALDDDRLVGTIQCWPCRFLGDDGRDVPLIMLGPVAVAPARQQAGIGRRLTAHALAAADAAPGLPPLMLIGDPEYYGRFFGFTAAATARWRVPGPVERHRLLARDAAPDGAGAIGPQDGS